MLIGKQETITLCYGTWSGMCVVGRLTDADCRLCGGLNKNSPYMIISLTTWSPLVKQFVSSPVWEMGVALFVWGMYLETG